MSDEAFRNRASGRMTITRGQTVYEFSAADGNIADVLDRLSQAERWVYDSPNRLSKLDEAANLAAAQAGDTVQVRTR